MKPRSWATHVLPEHHPETWAHLDGYTEAVKKVQSGTLVPAAPSVITAPRKRRTVESLTEERDRLTTQRDGLYQHHLPDDPGALSGIRKQVTNSDRKWATVTDQNLERYTTLTRRIDYLNYRIRKQS